MALYEMEVALAQVPGPDEPNIRPWMVDRLFRNLLVDVTGNTHRAEICIDKMWSPDSATGRLGLVEFRAFEMPPDARMSLAQQLLVRALVAWFWREPLDGPLVRWGTSLHDRFMLPHFVEADFAEILRDLEGAGYAFDTDVVRRRSCEFRFPALWHDRARRSDARTPAGAGAVARARRGRDRARGRRATSIRLGRARPGEALGRDARAAHLVTLQRAPCSHDHRDRYDRRELRRRRALQGLAAESRSMQPFVKVHAPLTFDIIDRWSRRSIGGCVYHVSHPGGRSYDTFPVNAFEAEARRRAPLLDPRPYERHPDHPIRGAPGRVPDDARPAQAGLGVIRLTALRCRRTTPEERTGAS